MPFLSSLRAVWDDLENLQHRHNTMPEYHGLVPCTRGSRPPSPVVRHEPQARLRCVRTALWMSRDLACHMLAERLSGISLSAILGILVTACEEVAVCWGGSVLVGSALGGVVGSFAAGVGAVPGAALGAGMGAQIGAWILGFLGLKSLIEDLGTAVPEILSRYEQGFRVAWGRPDRQIAFLPPGRDESSSAFFASREFAQGHVLLTATMLTALLAYLTRGRGDPVARARILQEIRESPRLGHKVAGWVAANEEALARHPGLKPREQQVVMTSQASPPTGPPVTPSQLRRERDGNHAPASSGSDHAGPPAERTPGNTSTRTVKPYSGDPLAPDFVGPLDRNARATLNVGKVTAPIDFDRHILSGEVKANGSVVGGHSIANGNVRVIPGTESLPNAQGVYQARIEVPDPTNPGRFLPKTNNSGVSTMFPDSWSADRVKVEVDAAYQSRTITGNMWTGTTPSGVVVRGYLNPKTTAYPVY